MRLKVGEVAPFDGHLLSDVAVAKLLSDIRLNIKMSEAEVSHLISKHKIKVKALKDSCHANLVAVQSKVKSCLVSYEEAKKLHDKAILRLNKDLARKNKLSWYKHPYIYLAVVTVLVAASTTAVVLLK